MHESSPSPRSYSIATAPSAAPDPSWLQWGGPRRNFTAETPALASAWPASGPKKLWERALGEGHSSILVEGGRLYTMYRPLGMLSLVRRSQQEIVTAIDASNGRTIWEHPYDAPTSGLNLSEGAGPHATPLIVGDRLFAMSSLVQIIALDKQSGKRLWFHDLVKEVGATIDDRGYSSSPIAYGTTGDCARRRSRRVGRRAQPADGRDCVEGRKLSRRARVAGRHQRRRPGSARRLRRQRDRGDEPVERRGPVDASPTRRATASTSARRCGARGTCSSSLPRTTTSRGC